METISIPGAEIYMDLYRENLDKKWGKGTTNQLYKLSQIIRIWDVRELNQLADAARWGFPAYRALYDELTSTVRPS